MIGTCQVSGDTGMPLVEYKGVFMIAQIKAERERHAVKPTAGDIYRDNKEQFDKWTGA